LALLGMQNRTFGPYFIRCDHAAQCGLGSLQIGCTWPYWACRTGRLVPISSRVITLPNAASADWINLALFGMQNRTFGPYFIRRMRAVVIALPTAALAAAGKGSEMPNIAETNGIHLVLFGMQNRTPGPCLAAIHRTLISVMQYSVQHGKMLVSYAFVHALLIKP
jgi:hypothetical protein